MAFFAGMVDLTNKPYRHRRDPELENARRAQSAANRLDTWSAHSRYYERCERENSKYEQFTSPRYYEANSKLYESLCAKRLKEETLERRRNMLRKLFMEEQQALDLEQMVAKCTPRSWHDEERVDYRGDQVPTQLLKKVYEQKWSDKEKKQEEAKENAKGSLNKWKVKTIEEQQQEAQKMEDNKKKEKFMMEKDVLLRKLKDDILLKEEKSEKLKDEAEAFKIKIAEVQVIEDKYYEEQVDKLGINEISLKKQRIHTKKLELKASQVKQQISTESTLVKDIQWSDLFHQLPDSCLKLKLQSSMSKLMDLLKNHEEMVNTRMKHVAIVFNCEAVQVFRAFEAECKLEEDKRKQLLTSIFKGLKQAAEDVLGKFTEQRQRLLAERQDMVQKFERQVIEGEQWELEREKMKSALTAEQHKREERRKEFDKLSRDEQKLRNEIVQMQRELRGRQRFFH